MLGCLMVKKEKSKNENFFVRFWNGKLSLPMSYWGVGVGIGILFGFIIVAFVIAAGLSDDAMWGFIIPFQIYTVVGIWRSANKYKGSKFWAILAKIAVVFGVFSNLASLLLGV
tara:strand:- start:3824 stop:4162 length:339 start_codon:yes stop_codon:yes gene_type:complete